MAFFTTRAPHANDAKICLDRRQSDERLKIAHNIHNDLFLTRMGVLHSQSQYGVLRNLRTVETSDEYSNVLSCSLHDPKLRFVQPKRNKKEPKLRAQQLFRCWSLIPSPIRVATPVINPVQANLTTIISSLMR